MKNLIVVLIWLVVCPIVAAQDLYYPKAQRVLSGNNRPQNIVAGGIENLFASFTPTPGVTYQTLLDEMHLCLGGKDSTGNVVTAVKSYGTNGADFFAGPNLPIPNDSLLKNSKDYDKIWKMTAIEIATFQEDLKDGVLSGTFPNIMSWPARNNPYSEVFNGFSLPENVDLAPFKDLDKDGIYDPKKGDFPMLEGISETNLPAVFYWCVYHDRGVHTFSKGKPMNVEVQQSAWLYDCKNDTILSNSSFISFKIINKGEKTIDSLKAGLFTDPDFYCNKNNMTGSIPDQNTFWMYQNSGYNEHCNITYSRYIKPAISFTFLNQTMAAFVATGFDGFNSLPQNILPNQSTGYYNLLQGKWATGDKITCCGVGYEKNTTQAATTFLFPENPNKTGGWSMQQNQNSIPSTERAAIGSVNLKMLLPNQSQRIDIAISYHQDTSYRKVLQATDLMYRNIPILQSAYNQKVLQNCKQFVTTKETTENLNISIFPNPFENQLVIENNNTQHIDYQILNMQGQLLKKGNILAENRQTIDTNFLPKGIYFIELKGENGARKVEKIVK